MGAVPQLCGRGDKNIVLGAVGAAVFPFPVGQSGDKYGFLKKIGETLVETFTSVNAAGAQPGAQAAGGVGGAAIAPKIATILTTPVGAVIERMLADQLFRKQGHVWTEAAVVVPGYDNPGDRFDNPAFFITVTGAKLPLPGWVNHLRPDGQVM